MRSLVTGTIRSVVRHDPAVPALDLVTQGTLPPGQPLATYNTRAVSQAETPKADTSKSTLETIAKWLGSAGAGRILDVPCGEGALLALLKTTGAELTGADIRPECFKLRGCHMHRDGHVGPVAHRVRDLRRRGVC